MGILELWLVVSEESIGPLIILPHVVSIPEFYIRLSQFQKFTGVIIHRADHIAGLFENFLALIEEVVVILIIIISRGWVEIG